ncbi:MAG: hypothetical protein P9L91_03355 [Candidatus Zophobacter franzmannii]|nr:hypothetical protein [Candidatus Zophobacter franzmannii]
MLCSSTPTVAINVERNYWGPNFVASSDLMPTGWYDYTPEWDPSKKSSPEDAPKIEYLAAVQYEEDEENILAEQAYQQVIANYPETIYARMSARALYGLAGRLRT